MDVKLHLYALDAPALCCSTLERRSSEDPVVALLLPALRLGSAVLCVCVCVCVCVRVCCVYLLTAQGLGANKSLHS